MLILVILSRLQLNYDCNRFQPHFQSQINRPKIYKNLQNSCRSSDKIFVQGQKVIGKCYPAMENLIIGVLQFLHQKFSGEFFYLLLIFTLKLQNVASQIKNSANGKNSFFSTCSTSLFIALDQLFMLNSSIEITQLMSI